MRATSAPCSGIDGHCIRHAVKRPRLGAKKDPGPLAELYALRDVAHFARMVLTTDLAAGRRNYQGVEQLETALAILDRLRGEGLSHDRPAQDS